MSGKGSKEARGGGSREREKDKQHGMEDNQFQLSHKAQVALYTCVLSRFRWTDRLPVLHLPCVCLFYFTTLLYTLSTALPVIGRKYDLLFK